MKKELKRGRVQDEATLLRAFLGTEHGLQHEEIHKLLGILRKCRTTEGEKSTPQKN